MFVVRLTVPSAPPSTPPHHYHKRRLRSQMQSLKTTRWEPKTRITLLFYMGVQGRAVSAYDTRAYARYFLARTRTLLSKTLDSIGVSGS